MQGLETPDIPIIAGCNDPLIVHFLMEKTELDDDQL
jgi:hypothetical protein